MSHIGNDGFNDYLIDQYEEALIIIQNSLKIGRPLFEFKRWEHLEPEARMKALKDSECPRCHKVKKLSGWWDSNITIESVCEECSDGNNQRYMDFRKDWDAAFDKYHPQKDKKI